MSISIHSENSKDEIETEDAELEDLVWNLMSRTGLLSQVQGQISKFIEDNGKVVNDTVSIKPERADGRILGFIFEYLQWIGMRQTNSVLLSESPVEVDVSIYESRVEDSDYQPELCKLFEDQNITEEKGSPTRSHNYSRDEFEDSRLTSASGHQSIRSDNVVQDEVNQSGNDSEEDESYSSHKQARYKSIQQINDKEKNSDIIEKPPIVVPETANVTSNDKLETNAEVKDGSADMINFNSPDLTLKGFDQIRPHVTLRQRFDLDTISDPFQSPTALRTPLDAVPIVDSNNRLNFVQASNSLDEILLSGDKTVEEAQPAAAAEETLADSNHSLTNKPCTVDKKDSRDGKASPEESAKESHKSEQKIKGKEPPSASQDEEESTSDFMDLLTMEDDTQDASIASDGKGMSSCEHAVSLK